MGGYLAAVYALQHPEHVAQLILVSPVGVPRKPSDWDDRMSNRLVLFVTAAANIYNALRRAAVCCLKHSALCGVAATPLKVTVALTFCPFWLLVTTWSGLIRLMGPGGPGMVRNAMAKRFPLESPEARESIAPYLYQITAARGSGEYALNLLLEPGAWARRPLCERLLPLQGGKLSSPINHICVSCSRSDALPLARAHFLNTVTL